MVQLSKCCYKMGHCNTGLTTSNLDTLREAFSKKLASYNKTILFLKMLNPT